jgi:2-dehydro-3-deoxygluconokinase
VFAALSASTALVAAEAMRAAKRAGTCVSYDLNYRPSLWRSLGGEARASEVNQALVALADVLFGNEEDFSRALGFDLEGVSSEYDELPLERYRELSERILARFPNLSTVAVTLRSARSASVNAWGGAVNHQGAWHTVAQREVEILDRVGGGDSFASGFIYGLFAGKSIQWALECGVAHGALAMSTPGDTSMASLREVLDLMEGKGARISR